VTAQTGNTVYTDGLYVDDVSETSPDSPGANPYAEWMLNRRFSIDCSNTARPLLVDPVHDGFLDLRSKRKLVGLQDTVWYCFGVAFSGTSSITIDMHFRTLLLLP
jgi:hypothetical protein